MAKRTKAYKLLKAASKPEAKQPAKGFGSFANRLASSKQKKWENMSETQKRLAESKKNNKMIKVSKKAKKFALLDDDQEGNMAGLTHRGKNIKDLKEFDDVNFNESDLQNEEEFERVQQKMNFSGFQASNNLLQDAKPTKNSNQNGELQVQKSKAEVYKQIIEKSKAYKLLRQQQFEQNLNMATELDEQYQELAPKMKFRDRDRKLQDRLQNRDSEYESLFNELRDDERVVSNKVVEKSEKMTERVRTKKNDQLKKLMSMEGDEAEDNDIRGWVQREGEESYSDDFAEESEIDCDQDSDSQQPEDISEANESDSEAEYDDAQIEDASDQQAQYDELDNVNLSSQEAEDSSGEEGQESDSPLAAAGASNNSDSNQSQLEYDENDYSSSSLEQFLEQDESRKGKSAHKKKPIAKHNKNKKNKFEQNSQTNVQRKAEVTQSQSVKSNPDLPVNPRMNKKRKLNTVF